MQDEVQLIGKGVMQGLTYLLGFLGSGKEMVGSTTSLILVGLGSYYFVLLGIIKREEKAVGPLTAGTQPPQRVTLPLPRNSPTCLPLHLFLIYSFLCGSLEMRGMSVNFLYRIHTYCLFP